MNSVLDAVRVLDLTQAMAGPYCAMLLGDLGADVIKIEKPGSGDQARGWGPPFIQTESTYFLTANRNKRSLTLDLNTPAGIGILHRLVQRADVFIINQPSRASLVKRRIDYDSLCALNARLIYCSITGYGFSGPLAERAGYDMISQGEAGLMSFTGEPGAEPLKYPVPIADITTGIYAALAILAALYARDRGAPGQFIDMALLDSQLSWLNHVGSDYMNAGAVPQQVGNAHTSIVPYQVFHAQDKYIIIGVATESLWTRFCQVLAIQDTIGADERFTTNRLRNEHREELVPLLQALIQTRPAAEWLDALRAQEIPCGPINTTQEALADPQTRARGMIVEIEHPLLGLIRTIGNPIKLSETGVTYRRHPPLLGEHTDEILRDLGESDGTIRDLHAQGIV
ncbi:MAG: CoA transferase [Anaerolineae bacterium]